MPPLSMVGLGPGIRDDSGDEAEALLLKMSSPVSPLIRFQWSIFGLRFEFALIRLCDGGNCGIGIVVFVDFGSLI